MTDKQKIEVMRQVLDTIADYSIDIDLVEAWEDCDSDELLKLIKVDMIQARTALEVAFPERYKK